jgi:TonB-linked SusC/RagA family outer membrane protein
MKIPLSIGCDLKKNHVLSEILMKVEFTIFLLVIVFLQVNAEGYSQHITLTQKNAEFENVFTQIMKQTNCHYLFLTPIIKNAKPVNVDLKNASLEEALDQCFKGQPFTYVVEKNTVVVRMIETPTILVKGKVTNCKGEPLAGISVFIKGQAKGTFTDPKGEYELEITAGDKILVFTSIGMKKREVEISGRTKIDVVLEEESIKLGEVTFVSTGYYTIPKERATGSFAIVPKRAMDDQVAKNFSDLLEGIAPGVLLNVTNEDGGNRTGIILRGIKSFQATQEALIVVDGFPVEGGLESINPYDIESVNVLQDAVATSIWGVRASNGVIVITTKRGKTGNPSVEFSSFLSVEMKPNLNDLQIADSRTMVKVADHFARNGLDINLTTSSTNPGAINPGLNAVSRAYLKLMSGIMTETQYDEELTRLSSVDVFPQYSDLLLRNAIVQQYNISVNSGNENSRTYFSYTHNDNQSVEVGDEAKRDRISINSDFTLAKKIKFSLGTNMLLDRGNFNAEGLGIFTGNASTSAGNQGVRQVLPRFELMIDETGNRTRLSRDIEPSSSEILEQKGFLNWTYNPLDEVENKNITTNKFNIRLQSGLRWDILPEWGIEVKGQYEWERYIRSDLSNLQTYKARNLINSFTGVQTDGQLAYNIPFGEILDKEETEIKTYYGRAFTDFHKIFGQKHELSALAGLELSQTTVDWRVDRFLGYSEKNALYNSNINWQDLNNGGPFTGVLTFANEKLPNPSSVSARIRRLISAFANVAYTFDNKYTVNGSIKGDQSNRVGANAQKTNYLWAIGGGWDISKERFFKGGIVNYLKMRGSYGVSGNIHENATSLPILTASINYRTGESTYYLSSFGNSSLTFEDTYTTNVGFDFGLFNNRLTGSGEYYNSLSKNVLADFALPAAYGFTSVLLNNGKILNNGITFNLTGDIIRNKNFTWNSNLNFTYNNSRVVSYQLSTTSPSSLIPSLGGIQKGANFLEGERVGTILSYRFAGLDDSGHPTVYDENNNVVPYIGGSVTSLDALENSGTTLAPYYGGFNNTFSYKRISLSIYMSYKMGHVFRRPTVQFSGNSMDNLVLHKDAQYTWSETVNENTTVPALPSSMAEVINENNLFYYYSDILVENASFIRLRQVSLKYDLQKWCKKLPLKGVSFTLLAQNLGLIWKANHVGIDPEAIPFTGSTAGEDSYDPLSIIRPSIKQRPVYTVGIKIQF